MSVVGHCRSQVFLLCFKLSISLWGRNKHPPRGSCCMLQACKVCSSVTFFSVQLSHWLTWASVSKQAADLVCVAVNSMLSLWYSYDAHVHFSSVHSEGHRLQAEHPVTACRYLVFIQKRTQTQRCRIHQPLTWMIWHMLLPGCTMQQRFVLLLPLSSLL